ncbi:hypothetical protein ACFQX6_47645 [Streptosporangium lutulentum]
MDDLKLLRDLGRDLEHDPPATLAHQRRRLLGASADAGSRRTRRQPMLGPLGVFSGAGSRRTRRWTMLGLIATATAAVALVPALFLGGHSQFVSAPVGIARTSGPRPSTCC